MCHPLVTLLLLLLKLVPTVRSPSAQNCSDSPRRVAFARDASPFGLTDTLAPKPLGISDTETIAAGVGSTVKGNALWFAANRGSSVAYDATNVPYPINTSDTTAGTTDGSKVPLPTLATESKISPYEGSQPLLLQS